MSHHSSDYESAAADLSEYFGQPISYIDPSLQAALEFDATVHPETSDTRKTDNGWVIVFTRDIYFDADLVDAKKNATVTIGETDYSVEAIGAAEGNRTMLKIKRTNAGEVSRPRARG